VSSEFAENFQEKYGGSEWEKKGFVWHQLWKNDFDFDLLF
jgi:hypothetical protein